MERAYTLSEIDRMRAALMDIINPHRVFILEGGGCFLRQGFFDASQRATGEDMLRTYMLGGISPEELEIKAKLSRAIFEKPGVEVS